MDRAWLDLTLVKARVQAQDAVRWAAQEGYARYLEPSIKGSAEVDGSDPEARRAFLAAIVVDAERLLGQTLTSPQAADREHPDRPRIMDAAGRGGDAEGGGEGSHRLGLRPGDAPWPKEPPPALRRSQGLAGGGGRKPTDHGRGRAARQGPRCRGALDLVSESERNIGSGVYETVADAAYRDGETRRQLAEAERTLIAKVPKPPRSPYFTKQNFHIDLEAGRGTCPAGEVTTRLHRQGRDRDGYGQQVPRRAFVFEGAVCDSCPLRPQCVKAAPGRGCIVSLHLQEGLLQEARALQASAAGTPYRDLRQVAELRLARLVQLDLRQARYRGRARTQVQPLLTATVANLTRIWAQVPA